MGCYISPNGPIHSFILQDNKMNHSSHDFKLIILNKKNVLPKLSEKV